MFSIRVHDFNHVLKERYEKEGTGDSNRSLESWSHILKKYLQTVQDRLVSVLFAVKNKQRIRTIIAEREMEDEVLVSKIRCITCRMALIIRPQYSVHGSSKHIGTQSLRSSISFYSRNLFNLLGSKRSRLAASTCGYSNVSCIQSDPPRSIFFVNVGPVGESFVFHSALLF